MMLDYLEKDIVFVFGSNEGGIHGAGAALTARYQWDAAMGVGEGRTGFAYAIPTKDADLVTKPLSAIGEAVIRFLAYATANPNTIFLVTKIGCGLAGYRQEDIAPLFAGAPDNAILPKGWRRSA